MNTKIAHVITIERRVSGLISAGHCHVFEAVAHSPIKKKPEAIFIKFADKHALFNELLASHIGKQLNIPTVNTYLCACPGILIINENLPFVTNPDEFHLGTASVKTLALKLRSNTDLAKIEDELLSWSDLATAAAFDELIINDDRHAQNILRTDHHKFALIDHEQAFGASDKHMNIETVFNRPTRGNYLANLIFRSGNEIARRRLFNASRSISESIQKLTLTGKDDLIFIEENRLNTNSHIKTIEALLKKRAKNLQHLIQHHEAANQLFAMSTN